MTKENTQLATQQSSIVVRASQTLAQYIGMEPDAMIDTIKAQCFKCPASQVTDAQMAAFISIANEMKVNPLLPGMLYAFPIQGGGIIPMIGPDGVYKKLVEHSEVDSWETEVFPEDVSKPATHAITKIYRKGRDRPLTYTALLKEWKVSTNPNWNTRERHMLGLRSLKQCARQIINGIPFDEDERQIMQEINVTPGAEQAPLVEQGTRPKVNRRGAAGAQQEPETKGNAGAIDIDTVAEKKAEPEKQLEKQPEKSAEKAAEKAPEKQPEKPEKTVDKTVIEPVRALAKDEIRTFVCQVKSYVAKFYGTVPACKVELEGEFIGGAFDKNVTVSEDKKSVTASPAWQLEQPVRVTLVGKDKGGVIVTAVEVVEDVP